MQSLSFEMATFFDRVFERMAQNLTISKLFAELKLDPNNITFDSLFRHLAELMLANINIANMCALVGAAFYATSFLMRTIVPLRVFVIMSAFFFMAYGALGGAIGTFLLYLLLLPINSLRLIQFLKLVKKARIAAQEDLSTDWLKPFMGRRNYHKADVVFRKGEQANEMFLIAAGKFLVREIGTEILPGQVVGELGFLASDNKRTQTVECVEDGAVLTIGYDQLLQVYFEHPDFAIYLLRLSTDRLLHNNKRLEVLIEQYRLRATATNVPIGSR